MLKGLLVKVLLMFIVLTLLVVSLLLVIVLTMFQVVLDLLVELDINLSKCIFLAAVMTEDNLTVFLVKLFKVRVVTVSVR